MRTAEKYPEFRNGWIVIDAREAPSLSNAIGSQIYKTQRGADAKLLHVRRFTTETNAPYLHAVPVDGTNDVFAIGYIYAGGVTVDKTGRIRMEARER